MGYLGQEECIKIKIASKLNATLGSKNNNNTIKKIYIKAYHLFDIQKKPLFAIWNFDVCLDLASAAYSTCLYAVAVHFEMTKMTGHGKFSN